MLIYLTYVYNTLKMFRFLQSAQQDLGLVLLANKLQKLGEFCLQLVVQLYFFNFVVCCSNNRLYTSKPLPVFEIKQSGSRRLNTSLISINYLILFIIFICKPLKFLDLLLTAGRTSAFTILQVTSKLDILIRLSFNILFQYIHSMNTCFLGLFLFFLSDLPGAHLAEGFRESGPLPFFGIVQIVLSNS